jgi:hypothetical protein
MGEVYRARDPALKREVAIKILPTFVSHDPDRLRRFEQEAQAAAALNHPNILAVHRFGTFEGAPYLVSELLEAARSARCFNAARCRFAKRSTTRSRSLMDWQPPTNRELFIATSSRRTSSSPRTAASRFWISGSRS